MDIEVKKALDLRLANGNITLAEYKEMLRTIAENEVIHNSKGETPDSQPSNRRDENLQTVLVVDQDLSLFDAFLMHKDKKYLYSDIKNINFSRFVASMNLAPYMNETGLFIVFDNDEKITYYIDRSPSRGKTSKLLEQSYYFLQKTTFNIRSKKLMNTLNKDGFIKFGTPEVCLYRDGTIEDENGRRLKISKTSESLRIGFGAQGVNFTDPNEIRISDKPRPFLQFDCFESKNTIKFHLYGNMDVIKEIFKYFLNK